MPRVPANLKRSWPVWAVLVAVVGLGSWHLSRSPRVQSPILPAPMVKMEPSIELQFHDVTMQGREKGTVRWRITSARVLASQNQQYIYFQQGPKGTFYNLKDWNPKDGAPARNRDLEWTAQKAEYDSLMEEMTITGSASFVTDDQDHLNAEEVRYKAKLHQVLVPSPVSMLTHDHLELRAHQATADTQLESVELAGNVEMISPLKGGQGAML